MPLERAHPQNQRTNTSSEMVRFRAVGWGAAQGAHSPTRGSKHPLGLNGDARRTAVCALHPAESIALALLTIRTRSIPTFARSGHTLCGESSELRRVAAPSRTRLRHATRLLPHLRSERNSVPPPFFDVAPPLSTSAATTRRARWAAAHRRWVGRVTANDCSSTGGDGRDGWDKLAWRLGAPCSCSATSRCFSLSAAAAGAASEMRARAWPYQRPPPIAIIMPMPLRSVRGS